MNKPKHWLDGFSSKEEEMEYWKEEGRKYQAYLASQKSTKKSKRLPRDYNPNTNGNFDAFPIF